MGQARWGKTDLEGVVWLAAHELERALQDGARAGEAAPLAVVDDDNV